jgi:hypothetical protein
MDFKGLFKNLLDTMDKNFLLVLGLLIFIIIMCMVFIIYFKIIRGRKGRVLYFDELEGGGSELDVTEVRAKSLVTNSNPIKVFLRTENARVYNFQTKFKSVRTWLGKRATAYLFKPASSPEGKAEKVGSFYDGLKTLLDDDQIKNLSDELEHKLKESKIFVTVNLEEGFTPDGYKPISEDWITTDADSYMASLFGESAKEGISSGREDMIKVIALIGCGMGITYVLQALGILGGI